MSKIILDLCGETGAWSKPYKDAGYDVRVITLPEHDVLTYQPPKDVYGILAAPPCTMFSFARTYAKTPRDLNEGMKTIRACLEIIWHCQKAITNDAQKYPPLKFWALENPYYAMTRWFLGKPAFVFDPWEFGHNYKKKTALWGHFNDPAKTVSRVEDVMSPEDLSLARTNSRKLPSLAGTVTMAQIKEMKNMAGTKNQFDHWKNTKTRQAMRSITPSGFAQAFFEANK
jgi:hypothetical protein